MHTVQAWLNSGAQKILLCWIHPKEGVAKVASSNSRFLLSLQCTVPENTQLVIFLTALAKIPGVILLSLIY